MLKAREILPADFNWRTHPESQRAALRGSLKEIGITDAVKVRRLEDGRYEMYDGHLRQEELDRLGPDTEVPCLVADLTESEARMANLVMDPIGSMAKADDAALASLIDSLNTDNEALSDLIGNLSDTPGESERAELEEFDTTPPPRRAWILISTDDVGATMIENELREKYGDDRSVRIEVSTGE